MGSHRKYSAARRAIPLFAGLALVVAGVALFVAPGTTKHTVRYVAVGDSYAAGTGASKPSDGYTARFAHWLARPGGPGITDFRSTALSGETTTTLLHNGQLGNAVDAIEDANSTTRAVSLNVGINELLSPACRAGVNDPACPFRADYQELVSNLSQALDEKGKTGRLMVLGLPLPFPAAGATALRGVETLLQGSDGRIDCAGTGAAIGMNDLIACIGARYGATYVDGNGAFAGREAQLISKDGLHPNDAGHAVLAHAFEQAFKHPHAPEHARSFK